jgi:hypothetical protein
MLSSVTVTENCQPQVIVDVVSRAELPFPMSSTQHGPTTIFLFSGIVVTRYTFNFEHKNNGNDFEETKGIIRFC